GVNCLAYDEAIMAQQDRIQQEIAVQNPLVSERLELAELYKEYAEDDHVYQEKIKVGTGRNWERLGGTGRGLRKTGGHWEHWGELGGTEGHWGRAGDGTGMHWGRHQFGTGSCCVYSQLMELIERVERRVPLPELLAAFNEPATSDYLVVYLRLLTSGCLQRHRRFFEQFLEGGRSIKEFCQQEVEPMCKESDHIHIIA
ncbi:OTUB1 thioesterase, partial [Molothrus ater]|nr:OTUB1 thioesterase [Molothrus ater]